MDKIQNALNDLSAAVLETKEAGLPTRLMKWIGAYAVEWEKQAKLYPEGSSTRLALYQAAQDMKACLYEARLLLPQTMWDLQEENVRLETENSCLRKALEKLTENVSRTRNLSVVLGKTQDIASGYEKKLKEGGGFNHES